MQRAGIGGHGDEAERGIHGHVRGVTGQVQLAEHAGHLELRNVDDGQPTCAERPRKRSAARH